MCGGHEPLKLVFHLSAGASFPGSVQPSRNPPGRCGKPRAGGSRIPYRSCRLWGSDTPCAAPRGVPGQECGCSVFWEWAPMPHCVHGCCCPQSSQLSQLVPAVTLCRARRWPWELAGSTRVSHGSCVPWRGSRGCLRIARISHPADGSVRFRSPAARPGCGSCVRTRTKPAVPGALLGRGELSCAQLELGHSPQLELSFHSWSWAVPHSWN